MNALRPGLPLLPAHMRRLAIDERGYPVPWFVAWVNGKPEFRVADSAKMFRARRFGYCWICGSNVGAVKTFLIGPMCCVNRVTSEPPCHEECAEFAALSCPFLTLPKAQRREANMPPGVSDPAGLMIDRNPGVCCLWTTNRFRLFDAGNGSLYRIGEPSKIAFFTEKRLASRAEVLASIESGMPILRHLAEEDGVKALVELESEYCRMLPLLPAA
jgi:hypothetical protein